VTLLRRLAFIALLIVLMLLAAMFAYSNPQPIDVDIGIARIEQISMALAFAVVFICGWLFGLLTAALALWRNAREKRRLRKNLSYAEAELSAVREVPLQDAH
jgi:lipopolysaccharide assembly protein A